jgi:L-2,4-diaminobutyric acid acetyltransferase
MALHRLVRDCPPLDQNSSYCNLLQCSHFKSTSIAAIHQDALVGSVTAYRPPEQPDTLFVWQVAVHASMRGQGLAREMLRRLFARTATEGIRYIETSITADNEASQRLFAGFAAEHKAEMLRSVMFNQAMHFEGLHDTEYLYRIGPVDSAAGSTSTEKGETP